MTTVAHIPSYEPDLFGDAALTSPCEHYRALRELGPVVRLEARGKMLEWASAQFNAMGPMNERCKAALPKSVEMTEYAAAVTASGNVTPGSLADDVVTAARRGEVTEQEAVRLMLAYIAPSLDTTISAIGSPTCLFASHPDQWQLLRGNPSLIPNAVNEVSRLESPIPVVGRRVGTPTSLAGFELMADEQVVILFGSAN